MVRLSHTPWFSHFNNILWRIQIMRLLVVHNYSTSCSRAQWTCLPPLISKTKFHAHTKQQVKLLTCALQSVSYHISNVTQDTVNCTVPSTCRILSFLNFFMVEILSRYGPSQVFQLCDIFEIFIVWGWSCLAIWTQDMDMMCVPWAQSHSRTFLKMMALWHIAPCNLVGVEPRFNDA
jgi:hypothetical protein